MRFKIIAVVILAAALGVAYLIFGQEESHQSYESSTPSSSGFEFSK